MSNTSLKDLEEKLSLDSVLSKATEACDWNEQDQKEAKEWYLKHLYLCLKYPDRPMAALSKKADDLWHYHILDTPKYKNDCEAVFGKFIHHQPIYGEPTESDRQIHEKTQSLYKEEFGEIPSDLAANSLQPLRLCSIPD